MSDTTYLFFGFIIVGAFCLIMKNKEEEDLQKRKLGELPEKDTFPMDYLGGIPSFCTPPPASSTITFNNTSGETTIEVNSEIETIPYANIISITKETKESLSASKLFALGIYAFALKSKKNYILFKYINDINEETCIVFEYSRFGEIDDEIQKMMHDRYYYLKQQKAAIARG